MSPAISNRLLATQSDERLLSLVGHGHERAFETLVKRYRTPLLRYCRRMRLCDSTAEEVVQHALLEAWLALAGGTQVRDLRSWLYRIVHNRALNTMRGASEEYLNGDDALAATATPAVVSSDLDRRMAVRDALTEMAALPRMQREAIFLTAMDGQTHEEVASALGVTHGAVRGLLYRARTTLRAAAAAITPQPLLAWMYSGAGGSGPTAERVAELSSSAGAAGVTGVLLKGAVAAVTAGVVLTGAAVVPLHGQHAHRRQSALSAEASAGRSPAGGSRDPLTAALGVSSSPAAGSQGPKGVGGARAGGPLRQVRGGQAVGRRRTAPHAHIVPAIWSQRDAAAGEQGAASLTPGALRGGSRERSDMSAAASEAAGLDSPAGAPSGARDASGGGPLQAPDSSGHGHGGDLPSALTHRERPQESEQGAAKVEPLEPAGGGDRMQSEQRGAPGAEPESANGN
jgi:RNA polymerase sigma factor (sigma-70 family)